MKGHSEHDKSGARQFPGSFDMSSIYFTPLLKLVALDKGFEWELKDSVQASEENEPKLSIRPTRHQSTV